MSFTVSIKNAPGGSRYWWAEYSLVYSGWLDVNVAWGCPYGAYGATDLRIFVVDINYNTLHDKSGLGPIYDDRAYVYDCSTQQLSEVAIGAYTQIVGIIAPSEAAYGDLVSIEVRVRNLYTTPIYIAVTGRYDGVDILFSPDYISVGAGATYSFSSSFTMPNNDVRLHVWSFYWTGTDWYQEDYSYVDIALGVEAPPEYQGTLTRMELEYDEAWASIPAYDIPQGKRGLVHIWGRNDMATTQQMGIQWVVRDPDGLNIQVYSSWEMWPYTSPGSEHGFLAGRFDINKPGNWTIAIELLMNKDNPVVIDTYYGTLCTVAAAVPEPEFRGFEITSYVER